MKKDSIFYWKIATAISLLIAISSLCLIWLRVEPFEFDLFSVFGLLVATLSVLVMILIGWQIYIARDFENKTNEIKKQSVNIANTIEINNFSTYQATSMVYYAIKDLFHYYQHSLLAIQYGLDIEKIDHCQTILNGMLEVGRSGIELTSLEQSNLLNIYYKTNKINKLNEYVKLEKIILKATITDESNKSQMDFY